MTRSTKRLVSLFGALAVTGIAAIINLPKQVHGQTTGSVSVTTQSPAPTASATATTNTPAVPTYMVVACNDGDTCRLKSSDNTQVKVRLVGIDAPEMGKRNKKRKKEGQPGGNEAKDFLNKLVVGKTVTLRSYGSDPYGRNLAEIMINNEPANLRMVSEGWAEVYRGKAPKGFDVTPYQTAQSDAMKNKKGVWGMDNYESPKDFRKRTKD